MTTTEHPALTVASEFSLRRDVCRRWCEQVAGKALGLWTYWAKQENEARAAQAWDDVCQHLPVELLHPDSEPHFLVMAHADVGGWVLWSVHVQKRGAMRIEPTTVNGQRNLKSVVLAWNADSQQYVLVQAKGA